MTSHTHRYAGYRYPAEIISYAIWPYFRFALSFRDWHYLWRAVEQVGDVLGILVQSRRNKRAAKRFFRKLLNGPRAPRRPPKGVDYFTYL